MKRLRSTTANADLDVDPGRESRTVVFEDSEIEIGGSAYTEIRVESPDTTFRGRHRYELASTLPAAGSSTGRVSLDMVGADDALSTDRVDVWVTGFDLTDLDCARSRWGAEGGCSFVERDGMSFASIEDLRSGEGITPNASIAST